MKTVNAVVALIVLLLFALALHNWDLVMHTMPTNLLVGTFDVSLALLLLIGMGVVSVVHFTTIGTIRMHAAIESRDLHRELDQARRTADTAEASRIADLRGYLDREIPQIELKLDQVLERLDARVAAVTRPVG